MRDELAARLSRDRQSDFRRRLDDSIVDRLRGDLHEMSGRRAAYLSSPRCAAGDAAEELRAERLKVLGDSIDWLTHDPRGQRWEPPAPRPRPVPKDRPLF